MKESENPITAACGADWARTFPSNRCNCEVRQGAPCALLTTVFVVFARNRVKRTLRRIGARPLNLALLLNRNSGRARQRAGLRTISAHPCPCDFGEPPSGQPSARRLRLEESLRLEDSRAVAIIHFPAILARRRASCSWSSGVNCSPKSAASKIWRISISLSWPGIGFGQRLTQSIASCIDLHCHSQ
jgi:hypothetical protein